MKKISIAILAISLSALALWGCKKDGSESTEKTIDFGKDVSYAIGMSIGMKTKSDLEMSGINPNVNELVKGFKDSLAGKDTRFDMDEAMEVIEAAFNSMTKEKNAALEQNEITFLAENSKKNGIIITPSGLQYEIIKQGSGPRPTVSDAVLVHYTGTLADGTVFDSSRERGSPATFPLDGIIPGFLEGLQLMNVGGNFILYIPSELGYGPEGRTNPMTGAYLIEPYSTLIFDIELIDIVKVNE